MAILDAHYPSELLKEEQMRKVEGFLIDKIVEGWSCKIRINNLKLGPGYITLNSEDSPTAAWLKQAVWAANTTLKINLKVVEEPNLPQAKLITMFLPKTEKMPREKILQAIKSSNDLDTERWQVISDAKGKEGKTVGRTLKSLIDENQQEKLSGIKNVIHFIFGPVDVYGQRGTKGKGIAKPDGQRTEDPSPPDTLTQPPVVAEEAEDGPEMDKSAQPDCGADVNMENECLLLEEDTQQAMPPTVSPSSPSTK